MPQFLRANLRSGHSVGLQYQRVFRQVPLLRLLRLRSVFDAMSSATASACARSSLPLRKARFVNSPGSASRAPRFTTKSNTAVSGTIPPWQLNSTMSSPVYVLGACMTPSKTSSITSSNAVSIYDMSVCECMCRQLYRRHQHAETGINRQRSVVRGVH